jgi:hypothetical protein
MGCGVYKMNSWDCFDTLVFRLYKRPHSIFEEVGRRIGDENFVKRRIKAEKRSDGTYKGIYNNLPDVNPSIEFNIELEHLKPIKENIQKVQDGDIIVSDMYLESEQIETILRNAGLTKQIKIIVTPDGKHKGYIWKSLKGIDIHTGDNYRSDVESPKEHNIRAVHYTEHDFNNIEQFVFEKDEHLALWMRYVRLNCPYTGDEKLFWVDQSNFNLPILALASLELPTEKVIAFNYRDSIYWHSLYEAMTNKKAKKIISSRKCLYTPSIEFKNYFISETKNCVIADLQGTGDSLRSFFGKSVDAVYICGKAEWSMAGHISDSIERHNCSSLRTLNGWNNQGPIYGECEHNPKVIEIQSSAMNLAISSAKYFKIKSNKNLMIDLLWKMRKNFTHTNITWKTIHD